MTSIPAAAASPRPGAINPQLAAIVQQMPADQQQAAMAKIAALSPQQQQQLLAEISRQAQAQGAAPVAAAAPAAGAQQATLGASALQPPNRMATILKNVGIFGGIGAALGFGASFFTLPIVGQVAAPIAAAVGGGIGAIAGLIKGFMSANKQQAAYDEAVAAEQAAAGQGQPGMPGAADGSAEEAPVDAEPTPPPVEVRRPRASAKRTTYKVVAGDSLSAIAARHDLTWQELYKANRAAVGPNPHLIHPGLKLKIPA